MAGSKIRLYGSTSGYVELEAPAVGDDGVLVLPTAAGGFSAAGIGSNVVQGVLTATFTSSSTSFVDVTGLSVTITPTSTSSKILLIADIAAGSPSSATGSSQFKLAGGNAGDYIGDASGSETRAADATKWFVANSENQSFNINKTYLDSPATTSPVTYTVQLRSNGGQTSYVNRTHDQPANSFGTRRASSLTAIEVAS